MRNPESIQCRIKSLSHVKPSTTEKYLTYQVLSTALSNCMFKFSDSEFTKSLSKISGAFRRKSYHPNKR